MSTWAITLTKAGKCDHKHGILNLAWDLRETMDLLYYDGRQGTMRLVSIERTVEERSLAGGIWKSINDEIRIPAGFEVPVLIADNPPSELILSLR